MNAPNIPHTPRNEALGDVLAMLFYVCAAHEDATAEQGRDLADRLRPEVQAFKTHKDPGRVVDRLREIMPDGWRPQGQWADGIADPLGTIGRELLRRGINGLGPFA
ncbi:hypothetical protein [Nocardia sp. NPDC057455]|uniref:hypothetical protein n=1 Tax=Nocardia sp. NPDC057455 TaxID=3346138 RepID=UPI00366CDA7B